jgi:DNA-binding NarL/FixJ family response regulator
VSTEIKIFIIDDYFLIREGIKKIINELPNAVIVGESHDLSDLTAKMKNCLPDIIIMELNLCDNPLRDFMQEIKTVSAQTKVLIVSDCDCELPVITAIRSGIAGFIKKNVSEEELIKAIQTISKGADYFSPEITQLLANSYLSGSTSGINLSDREMEILRYICKGRSNEQIAEILFISEKTVATHRKNIMKKAVVKKTSDLILWALENKIVQK